jgi:DNA polymerase elongation subunit (family B)
MPLAGWKFCKKNEGILPAGLRAVLHRRLMLKRMMKAEMGPEKRRELDLRQRALKNILVTELLRQDAAAFKPRRKIWMLFTAWSTAYS